VPSSHDSRIENPKAIKPANTFKLLLSAYLSECLCCNDTCMNLVRHILLYFDSREKRMKLKDESLKAQVWQK